MTMHPSEMALNEYADAALTGDERAAVADHLQVCDECQRTVDDLRRIRDAARALPPMTAPDIVWPRVRDEIARTSADGARTAAGPVKAGPYGWSWWKGLAAAAVIVLAVSGWYVVAHRARTRQLAPSAASTTPPDAQAVAAEFQQAREHYEKAITGVEQIMNSEKGTLDAQTAATIVKGFPVVDQAIEESQAALKQNPASVPAQQSLLDNFRTKLTLLEDTVALINEMRKGNEAGAAKIASTLKQKG